MTTKTCWQWVGWRLREQEYASFQELLLIALDKGGTKCRLFRNWLTFLDFPI